MGFTIQGSTYFGGAGTHGGYAANMGDGMELFMTVAGGLETGLPEDAILYADAPKSIPGRTSRSKRSIQNQACQKGRLFGFSSRDEAVLHSQHRKCLFCGRRKIMHYHYIIPKGRSGSKNMDNIVGLCLQCHALVHKDAIAAAKLKNKEIGPLEEIPCCQRVQPDHTGAFQRVCGCVSDISYHRLVPVR